MELVDHTHPDPGHTKPDPRGEEDENGEKKGQGEELVEGKKKHKELKEGDEMDGKGGKEGETSDQALKQPGEEDKEDVELFDEEDSEVERICRMEEEAVVLRTRNHSISVIDSEKSWPRRRPRLFLGRSRSAYIRPVTIRYGDMYIHNTSLYFSP